MQSEWMNGYNWNVRVITHFLEIKLLKLYSVLLEKNLFIFLFMIDLILPRSDFKLQKKNKIQKLSEISHSKKLPQFTQEIISFNGTNNPNIFKLIVFVVPDSNNNLTQTTIVNLARSLRGINNVEFIVITRFGDVIISSKKLDKKLSVQDIINLKPSYIFFEIHTIFDNYELLEEQNLYNIKKLTQAKLLGICFDIWRDFDLKFINKWSGLLDYFIHMDQESAVTNNLDLTKMIFWPFAGWVNSITPKLNKNKVIYFSGNIRPSDRRYILKFTGKICQKFNLQINIDRADHSESTDLKSEVIYFKELNNSQYVLGLAQKSQSVILIPFRSLEAIFLNCTLIQQELNGNSPLSNMFIPYEHYLPFNTLEDIEIILKGIKVNNSEYVLMGKNSGEFMAKYYSPERMWSYLFAKIG